MVDLSLDILDCRKHHQGAPRTQDEARKVYDAFGDAGGNFIDTANLYTNGSSETFLGEFMKGHRESIVLGTTNAAPGKNPNASSNQCKSMFQAAVESSLKRPPQRKTKGDAPL